MTFWTIVLAGFIGGIASAITAFIIMFFGYWLHDRIVERKRKRGIV